MQDLKNMQESIVLPLYNPDILDETVTIEDEESFETTRILAVREGIFAVMSGGAAIACAIKFSKSMSFGTIVTILPDLRDRYPRTALFRSTCAKCPP